MNTVLSAMF